MWYWAFVLFLIHNLVTAVDEGYFHLRRGLGLWERIGHPVDAATVVACYAMVVFSPYTHNTMVLYVILAVFSCLCVTKDELVHAPLCTPGEMWIHSVMFMLHPVLLFLAWLSWSVEKAGSTPSLELFRTFFVGQLVLALGGLLYQIIYWNFLWKPPLPTQPQP